MKFCVFSCSTMASRYPSILPPSNMSSAYVKFPINHHIRLVSPRDFKQSSFTAGFAEEQIAIIYPNSCLFLPLFA